jgi:hypothetical protein
MNLNDMRALVRRDLHDEDNTNYRWTDTEIDRHITRALKDFSNALPLEQKAALATTAGSREISLASLTNRVIIERVEYPVGQFPPANPRFGVWNDILTFLGDEVPDGSGCCIYYGKLHTLDSGTSTIPTRYEELIAAGACGFASLEMAFFTINRVNSGGTGTPEDWESRGLERLAFFMCELKRLGRNNKVRTRQLYNPF